MTVQDILDKLDDVKKSGAGYVARCPAPDHPDRNPSLSIGEGDDGRILIKCHAGCTADSITAGLGIWPSDLFPAKGTSGPPSKAKGKPEAFPAYVNASAVYQYHDRDGRVCLHVWRLPGKSFRQGIPDEYARPKGAVPEPGCFWKPTAIDGFQSPLYRLEDVTAAIKVGAPVILGEGEKDADAIRKAGAVGTTMPGGAGKFRDWHAGQLAGAHLIVVTDKDDAGYRHALDVARKLDGIAASVSVRQAATGKDAADHLAAGHGLDEFEEITVERLRELAGDVDEAPVLTLVPDAAEAGPRLRFVTGEEFIGRADDLPEPLVKTKDGGTLLPAKGNGIIFGKAGGSKTTLTVDFVAHAACGRAWLGLRFPRPLRVLVVENEGPRAFFREKIRAKVESWEGPRFIGNVHFLEDPWSLVSLRAEGHADELRAYCEENEIDVVVAGPLKSLGAVGAGSLDDVGEFEQLLKSAGMGSVSAWVLVHHEARAGTVSGAWERLPDWLAHVSKEPGRKTKLHHEKARWASELHDQTWILGWADGESFSLLSTGDGDDEAKLAAKAIEAAADIEWMRRHLIEHPNASKNQASQAFKDAGAGSRDRGRKAFDQVRGLAPLDGAVSRAPDGCAEDGAAQSARLPLNPNGDAGFRCAEGEAA